MSDSIPLLTAPSTTVPASFSASAGYPFSTYVTSSSGCSSDDAQIQVVSGLRSLDARLMMLDSNLDRQLAATKQLDTDLTIACVLLGLLVLGRLITWFAWAETAKRIHEALSGVRVDLCGERDLIDELGGTLTKIRRTLRRDEVRKTALR